MYKGIEVFNIRDFLTENNDGVIGENQLNQILSEFLCGKNADVERFLKTQSVEFTKKNQSVTYLVFSEEGDVIGYFTIAIKPICVNLEKAKISKSLERKIARVGELDEETNTYTLSAYLIAQISKNFFAQRNESFSGKQLLEAALETIKQLQYMTGGMVVFLESEDNEKLLRFYEEENGFKRFDVRIAKKGTQEERNLIQLLKVI